ncbi:hypothetical protein WDZ92_19755, partial [Nostoc sp. NIES-2111]
RTVMLKDWKREVEGRLDFFFKEEDGIRVQPWLRGLGIVYRGQGFYRCRYCDRNRHRERKYLETTKICEFSF